MVVEQRKAQLQDEFYGFIRTQRSHMCSTTVYNIARSSRVGRIKVQLLQRQFLQASSQATECESPRQSSTVDHLLADKTGKQDARYVP